MHFIIITFVLLSISHNTLIAPESLKCVSVGFTGNVYIPQTMVKFISVLTRHKPPLNPTEALFWDSGTL